LVRLLEDASTDDTTKSNAARALCLFADANENNKAAVAAAGAIPPLVELLRGGSDEGRAEAAEALWVLVAYSHDDNDAVIPLVELLRGGLNEYRAEAFEMLVELLRGGTYVIKEAVAAAGAIPLLVELLRGGSDEGNAMAAEALMILVFRNNAVAAAVTEVVELVFRAAEQRLGRGQGVRRGGAGESGVR